MPSLASSHFHSVSSQQRSGDDMDPDTDWLEADRDEFIDRYLADHPEATEFEAALMWAIAPEIEVPKDYHHEC